MNVLHRMLKMKQGSSILVSTFVKKTQQKFKPLFASLFNDSLSLLVVLTSFPQTPLLMRQYLIYLFIPLFHIHVHFLKNKNYNII